MTRRANPGRRAKVDALWAEVDRIAAELEKSNAALYLK